MTFTGLPQSRCCQEQKGKGDRSFFSKGTTRHVGFWTTAVGKSDRLARYWCIPENPKSIPRFTPVIQQNFIDSVKSRQQTRSKLEIMPVKWQLPMHLAMISYKLQKPVEVEFQKGSFSKKDERKPMDFFGDLMRISGIWSEYNWF